MARLQSIAKRLSLLLPLMLIAATNAQEKDYTCYPRNDYSSDPTCPTVDDDVCDDPNLGGSGGEGCRNQDCIDCNYHCKRLLEMTYLLLNLSLQAESSIWKL